jgi:hypothetical protein
MSAEMVAIGAVALGFAVVAALAGIGFTVDFFAVKPAKPRKKT